MAKKKKIETVKSVDILFPKKTDAQKQAVEDQKQEVFELGLKARKEGKKSTDYNSELEHILEYKKKCSPTDLRVKYMSAWHVSLMLLVLFIVGCGSPTAPDSLKSESQDSIIHTIKGPVE